MLIKLTAEDGTKFYLNAALIEKVKPRQFRGGSEILLTSGRWMECIETAEQIAEMLNPKGSE